MRLSIFDLMSSGMTYDEALNFQIKLIAIEGIIILLLYSLKIVIKKKFPMLYRKLEWHNIF